MSLQDFRGLGSPADIGAFTVPASVIVYQHTFSGTTYVCAARFGDRGWVLVAHLALTGANATTVILAAFAALTAGRTWKEKVVVMGNYVDLGQLALPDYIVAEIIGYLKARNALNTHLITNSDPTGGNTDITIIGGHVDANKENQTADMSCIHLQNVQRPEVYRVKVRGGARPDAVQHGEGICLWDCDYGKVVNNYCYEAYYDNIKIRGGCTFCLVAGNTCKDSETKGGIQISSASAHTDVIANLIHQNFHALDNGIRIHNVAEHTLVDGNTIYCYQSTAIQLMDATQFNTISNNIIYTNSSGIGTFGNVPAADRPSYNYFKNNTIHLATNAANTGIAIDDGDYNEIKDNTIYGFALSTGIRFSATYCSYNRLGSNNFYNLGTNVNIPDNIDVEFIDCMIFIGASYTAIGAGVAQTYGVLSGKSTCANDEAQMRQIIAKKGIFRNAYVRSNAAIGAGETLTLYYRNEAADTPIVVVLSGAGVLSSSDRAHSFTCTYLDRLAVRITETAGVPATHLQWAVQFLPF